MLLPGQTNNSPATAETGRRVSRANQTIATRFAATRFLVSVLSPSFSLSVLILILFLILIPSRPFGCEGIKIRIKSKIEDGTSSRRFWDCEPGDAFPRQAGWHFKNKMSIQNVTANSGSTPIIIETGKLAKLADGAVTVRCGETIILVTAVSATKIKEGQDWFPLSVEYREKAAAVGRFPGGYFKREGRPTEKEVLTARMTDRPLRPLFPKGYLYDTQIVGTLMSADGQNDPDMLSINGASAALMVSDIPFAGPVGAVRVGRINGEFIANPTHAQRAESDLDLVYVGTENDVIMIEGAGNEIPEADFIKALEFGHIEAVKLCVAQKELAAKVNKAKREMPLFTVKDEVMEVAYEVAGSRIEAALYTPSKVARSKAVNALKDEVGAAIKAKFPEATPFEISQAFDYLQKKAFRVAILDRKSRCDGRGLGDLRQLSAETGLLPRSHGSALFARGETQALCLAHPRDHAGSAGHGRLHRRRDQQGLHPALQLPALLGRRNRPHGRHEPPRNRPRRTRRAFHRAGHPLDGRLPVRHPHQQRSVRVERLHLDGLRLRRRPRAHGCGRADQDPRRRHQRRPRD